MASTIVDIKTMLRGLRLAEDPLPPQSTAECDGVNADGRPAVRAVRLDLKLAGCVNIIVIENRNDNHFFENQRLPNNVCTIACTAVCPCQVVEIQANTFSIENGTAEFPCSIRLIVTDTICERSIFVERHLP